ncbi:hypothetical protein ACFPN0_12985 [Kitasatospora cinereorecta]
MTPTPRASFLSGAARWTGRALPPARYDAMITQGDAAGAGYRVTVTARTLLRDLALFPGRLDPAAEVDDMLVTLLPGERAVFHVTGAVLEDPGRWEPGPFCGASTTPSGAEVADPWRMLAWA